MAIYATFDIEQLISYTISALADTIASQQGFYGGVIPVSEVHELPTKIHDIWDNAVAKWVGNTACILVYLLFCLQAAS